MNKEDMIMLEKNSDFAGTFHVTTTWEKHENDWRVVFNMDQRVLE